MKTVKDIMELIDKNAYIDLVHQEEEDMRGIYKEISERGSCECFINTYGFNKMDKWIIESITTYIECTTTFIRIKYCV